MNSYFFKRLFDFIVSLLIVIILGWLIILCFVISSIVHKSNGFYLQERIGKKEKRFYIFKLKSMNKIKGYESTITTKNDPRVTKFGSFLRKTKLDELPQVINVLLGSMSLVGPRPTVESDYKRMITEQKMRFNVKPGITGLAQVNGNTSMLWPERIDLDLEYIEKRTFFLDIKIILETISLVLTNTAETHPASDDEWESTT